jgi:hypothetical protein
MAVIEHARRALNPAGSARRRPLAWLAALLLALSGSSAWASGDYELPEDAYTPEFHILPDELPAYAAGQLGVLQGSYWRVYQFLAWRALSGMPLSKDELESLHVDGWLAGPLADNRGENGDGQGDNGVADWVAARQPLAPPGPGINVNRDAANYEAFLNCPADAFLNAASTLQDRLKQYGEAQAKIWLAGQDAVFQNCGAPPSQAGQAAQAEPPAVLPPDLPAAAPAWLVRDHAYQSAAALFYAERFDQARAAFLAVGKDADSPWQALGNYLAARCLLRKASLQGGEGADADAARRKLMEQGRQELVAASKSFPAALGLVGWVDMRIHRDERRAQIEQVLTQARLDPQFPLLVADYILIMDDLGREQMMASPSALTAWIGAMQAVYSDSYAGGTTEGLEASRTAALALARARMKDKPQPLWLVPLLLNARAGELSAKELAAAAAVPPSSPAYETLQYHLARLALLGGHGADAAAVVARVLDKDGARMSVAAHNRWLGLQMLSSADDAGFLKAAPRHATAGGEQAAGGAPQDDYRDDFYASLFGMMPVEELIRLRQRPGVPDALHKRIAEVAWTRAVLLEDYAAADGITDAVAEGRDTTRPLYERYNSAPDPAAKRIAASLILANTPELVPESRDTAGRAHDWGCLADGAVFPTDTLATAAPAYLAPAQVSKAAAERAALDKLPVRTSYLIPIVMAWAAKNPQDEEGPKALHFLVQSTRYDHRCKYSPANSADHNYSEDAFRMLHKQFPKSGWTRDTPYHY